MVNQKSQEKYIMLQLIAGQMMELEKEAQTIEQRKLEISILRESLEQLKGDTDRKGFSALGLGLYIPSKINPNEDILINVGANILVKKTQDEVKEILDAQIGQAQLAVGQLIQNLQILEQRAMVMQKEMKEDV